MGIKYLVLVINHIYEKRKHKFGNLKLNLIWYTLFLPPHVLQLGKQDKQTGRVPIPSFSHNDSGTAFQRLPNTGRGFFFRFTDSLP